MVTYAGKNAFLLAGVESTFNTAVTANKNIGIVESFSPSSENGNIMIKDLGDRQVVDNVAGSFNGTLSIDGEGFSGPMLEIMFGQCTDAATSTDYKHTFVDVGVLEVPRDGNSATLLATFDSSTDVATAYSGCKLNTYEMSAEVGSEMKWKSEVIYSKEDNSASAGTRVQCTTQVLSFANITVTSGTDGAEASTGVLKSISLKINQDLEQVKGLGSRLNQDLVEKVLRTEIEFTKTFQNMTERNRFLGGSTPSTSTPTDTSIIIAANNGITLGSGRVEFYCKLKGGQYKSLSTNQSTEGLVEETFSYEGGRIEDLFVVDSTSSYF